jgi:hypothetical protein
VTLDVVVFDQAAVLDPLVHGRLTDSVTLDVVVFDQAAVLDPLVYRSVTYSVALDVLLALLGGVLFAVLAHGPLPLW